MELEALMERYRGPLMGLVASWGASWADAEEIAMDAFAESWFAREACRRDWREPAVFGAWVRGFARNLWRNRRRADRRRGARIRASEELVAEASGPEELPVPEAVVRLRKAITRLPRKLRVVVLMHHLEESPTADVAALLGVTPKAVERRLHRAREHLRRRLAAEGASPGGVGEKGARP